MSHSQRKPRGRAEVVIFGRRTVLEAFELPSVTVNAVRLGDAVPATYRKRLGAACEKSEVELDIVPMREVGRWSHEPKHDQGVAARVTLGQVSDVNDWTSALGAGLTNELLRVVALDHVTNPQNVGMIVRAAAAFGIDAMLWPTQGVPWMEGLVIKASAGTALRIPIATCRTAAEGIIVLQNKGFRAVGLDGSSEQAIGEFDAPRRVVLVLGEENDGLTMPTKAVLDLTARIEIEQGVESLNVATAAAVACYALTRNLRAGSSLPRA